MNHRSRPCPEASPSRGVAGNRGLGEAGVVPVIPSVLRVCGARGSFVVRCPCARRANPGHTALPVFSGPELQAAAPGSVAQRG